MSNMDKHERNSILQRLKTCICIIILYNSYSSREGIRCHLGTSFNAHINYCARVTPVNALGLAAEMSTNDVVVSDIDESNIATVHGVFIYCL